MRDEKHIDSRVYALRYHQQLRLDSMEEHKQELMSTSLYRIKLDGMNKIKRITADVVEKMKEN